MASDRFVKFSETDVKSFSDKQDNANTKNKTSYNLKLFKKFLASKEEMRKLKKLLPPSCKNLRQSLCSVLERKMVQGWRSVESTRLPPMWPRFDFSTRRHM